MILTTAHTLTKFTQLSDRWTLQTIFYGVLKNQNTTKNETRFSLVPRGFSYILVYVGPSAEPQPHHRRHDDDNDPRQKKRPARDRAPHPARGMCGQWTWRGCGARLARALVRVVRHAERRRGI